MFEVIHPRQSYPSKIDNTQERGRGVDDLQKSKVKLANGPVGVDCLEVDNVFGVSDADEGGIPWGVDFLRTMSAAT